MKKFYITTAIPYVNAAPHLGHALEFIQTDAIARYQKLIGNDVFLVTGADENSLKNVQAAEAKGITTAQLCLENAELFRKMAEKTKLSFNSFLRTSIKEPHFTGVQKLWKLCDKNGDIYKKTYSGLYCVGCEAFYELDDLPEGVCPEHRTKLETIEEENYFFKLSKYQEKLEKLVESDELKILPETRKNEVLSFIRGGLKDFSISRSVKRAKGWGVEVPGDSNQIMYVWFDALGTYITGIGYSKDEEKFNKYWPADVHVIGKGIIRFHAVYWPAILLSAGLEIPKTLFVHGYITVEGQKMSKSLGNIVDPFKLIEKYSLDTIRYTLLSEVSTFEDGDFSEKVLIEKNNSELLANLGNLVNRTLVFLKNNFNGIVPQGEISEADKKFLEEQQGFYEKFTSSMDQFKLKDGVSVAMSASKNANKYFQDNKPWELVKTNKARADTVLHVLVNQVKDMAILFSSFVPDSSKEIFVQLSLPEQGIKSLGKLSVEKGHKIGEPKVIFKKLELVAKADLNKTVAPIISIHFSDLDIEVGQILSVEKHPNADKLYVEKVQLGADKIVQIVSGIAKYYTPEQLLNKKVLILRNIPSALLRGVESQGMVLAAEDKSSVEVVFTEAEVGTKVTLEGTKQTPKPSITIDDFFKVSITVKDNFVFAQGKKLVAGNQEIRTEKVKEGEVG
ncbi:MAG: methionine--tRNA ligase [Candidatus Micrarchaeota archaeon]